MTTSRSYRHGYAGDGTDAPAVDPAIVAKLERTARLKRMQARYERVQAQADAGAAHRRPSAERVTRRKAAQARARAARIKAEARAARVAARAEANAAREREALEAGATEVRSMRGLRAAYFVLNWREESPASINREAAVLADRLEPPDPFAFEREPDAWLPVTMRGTIHR